MDLAVVLVTWNVHDLIANALRSLLADLQSTPLSFRVVVVDSASSDGTPDVIHKQFPQVELITSEENLGFGRANNLAMRTLGFGQQSTTSELPKAVYLLNPDTITKTGATYRLYETLVSDEKIGMVGAQLSYEDGSFQHGAFHFPGLRQLWTEFFPTPGRWIEGEFNGRYLRQLYADGEPFPVDFTLGATMMLKREVLQQTGMFDEAYFMYCEEIDWAWRIRQAGWEIYCVPQAKVVHLSGKSTSQVRPQSLMYLWESRLRLYEKHYPKWKLFIAKRLIQLGMRRKIQELATQHEPNPPLYDAYQTIYRLASQ